MLWLANFIAPYPTLIYSMLYVYILEMATDVTEPYMFESESDPEAEELETTQQQHKL